MAKNEAQQQAYDNVLKRLVEHQAEQILPLLFGDAAIEVYAEENVELLIPPRRSDRVYRARLRRRRVILDVEFEVVIKNGMPERLLVYHVLLLQKYHLPVKSLLIYPFAADAPESPFREILEDEELLTFRYTVLPLGKLDARKYTQNHAVPIYGFLPAMSGTDDNLLLQAIDDMLQYYRDDEEKLREELLCFRVLLQRARRLPEQQFERVLRRIQMFDPFLEGDPWIQQKAAESFEQGKTQGLAEGEAKGIAKGEAKGIAEGIAKGEARGIARGQLLASRSILLNIIRRRFPTLSEAAEARIEKIEQPEVLSGLIEQAIMLDNENALRTALGLHIIV